MHFSLHHYAGTQVQNDSVPGQNIPSLVGLRKAEMDHEVKMERIDMECDQMTHDQRLQEK